jgi:membrane-associated protease RseP (regulator of RpoE activity)
VHPVEHWLIAGICTAKPTPLLRINGDFSADFVWLVVGNATCYAKLSAADKLSLCSSSNHSRASCRVRSLGVSSDLKKEALTMFRYQVSKALLLVFLCSGFGAAVSFVRHAHADTGDVVDLNGDTHHNPPASTTDKSTPSPGTAADAAKPLTKEDKDSRDSAKQDAAEEKLKLRAGERVGDGARGSAKVLGMSLQEGTHERVKVVDVTMNSPAFDAGVMKGDEILAFQGFRGESYAKWIDGIRRLSADTGAGLKIPVVVARDGKQLTVRIEIPERTVRPSTPRVVAQPLIPPGVGAALPATGAPTGGPVAISGGNNVAIDNSGPFGAFFGGEAAGPNERAIAHIVRVGGQPSSNPNPVAAAAAAGNARNNSTPPQNSPANATAAPVNGARIGMAGFRDDPSGMIVMVDVGALPPGNYTVGISDPSVIGGAAVTGPGAANPNVQAPPQLAPPQSPVPAPNNGGRIDPNRAAPSPAAAGQQQGSLPPASLKQIPRTILAQVGAPAGASPGTVADPVPPTGDVRSPTGEVNRSQIQPAKDGGGVGSATLNHIGTITVDQTGTGRMQQKVESAQVRNVVGQAIVLYSQGGSPQTVPNAPGTQATLAPQTANSQSATSGTQVPVAGGLIQLVTDRRPAATAGPQTSQTPAPPNGAVEQPANATPPAGQNLVR